MHGRPSQLDEIETLADSVIATPPRADMLNDAGVSAVILGHLVRRRFCHETDTLVAAKAVAAWAAGISAIGCLGETKEATRRWPGVGGLRRPARGEPARSAGRARNLGRLPTIQGDRLRPHARRRGHCRYPWAHPVVSGGAVRRRRAGVGIRYGGSTTASNARAVLARPDLGGVLISGASLSVTGFDAALHVSRAIPFTRDAAAS